MSSKHFFIRKVAILGATSIGVQLAAHLVNVGIETVLFDLPAKEGDPNTLVKEALQALTLLQPSPLAEKSLIDFITPANYEHDLSLLKECDLVIEAISERLEWKCDLYRKIMPHLTEKTFFLCHTSTLSIEKLAESLEPLNRARFCGIHFFNPVRYMKIVELIPHATTDRQYLEYLETFLVTTLGKGVIFAKDTPNFIADRMGIFSFLSIMHYAEHYHLAPDAIDIHIGSLLGRTPPFATLDDLGLDVFANAVRTMELRLVDDPWYALYKIPNFITNLIQKGILGKKTKSGIYRKVKDETWVVDKQGNYRPVAQKLNSELSAIFKINALDERFLKLRESQLPEAKFLWAISRDLFHYAAVHLTSIAPSCRELDLALKWGYGHEYGPFELWQLLGWKKVISWIEEDIRLKHSVCNINLPAWVYEVNEGVYKNNTVFSPERGIYLGKSKLPVYQKQLYSDRVQCEKEDEGKIIFETEAVKLWTLQDFVGILSFKTKHNTITPAVLESILEAISRAEREFKALVLWQKEGNNFSFGANLKLFSDCLVKKELPELLKTVKLFQQTALALRYAEIPTIAAIRGLTLGGGLELAMHCTCVVAALETYPGLVETGIGIIPAGAGSKEMALRATLEAKGDDHFQILQNYFKTLHEGVVAKSALEAKKIGFLRTTDVIVNNPDEILYIAKEIGKVKSLNHRPPLKHKIMAAGKSGAATMQVGLINLREQGFISDHDYLIGSGLAHVICAGEVQGGHLVPEDWMLELERQLFMDLIQTKKTQDRIQYMLEHGRTLKN